MKQRKSGVALKAMDGEGRGMARIATLSAVDHDGDTYAKGAFGSGQWGLILASHNWSSVPLGKARIFESGDEALAELHLNLSTEAGKEWHAALKFDLENLEGGSQPVQEWSYGFHVLDAAFEVRDGAKVRVLKGLKVFEVSPVVQGAGMNTGTMVMKGATLKNDYFQRLISELDEIAAAAAADPLAISATGLKQIEDLHGGLSTILEKAGEEERLAHRAVAGQAAREFEKRMELRAMGVRGLALRGMGQRE